MVAIIEEIKVWSPVWQFVDYYDVGLILVSELGERETKMTTRGTIGHQAWRIVWPLRT